MEKKRFGIWGIVALLILAFAVMAWTMRAPAAAAPITPAASATPAAAGPSGYHLLKTIKLGGEGFWDYIEFDSPTRRLFVSRGTKVMVVDVDSGKVVGEIPDTEGV
ncbi:MAG: hypothetical protein ACRD41_07575, partial [Candidatus Acidiferrales bacterium]